MAKSMTARTLIGSVTVVAGTPQVGTGLDIRDKYGGTWTAKVTNGGTGPTIGCTVFIECSHNNSDWYLYDARTAGVVNSEAYTFSGTVDQSVMYLRARLAGNTAQNVTGEVLFQEITTIT